MASCVEVASTTTVDIQLLIERPKAALLGILKRLKGWEKAKEDTITVEQFSGAMTNLVYRCGLIVDGKEEQLVLMRVHASASTLFDRAAEISTFQGVSTAGMGPKLLLLFDNGRVEEFLGSHVTLAAADIHEPSVSAALAETLAHFHIRMSDALAGSPHHSSESVQLWGRLHDWLALTQQHTTTEELAAWGMEGLEAEISQLQQVLTHQHPCWVALCHNDLQYGNIMALAEHDGAAAAAEDEEHAAVAAERKQQEAAAVAAVGGIGKQLGELDLGQTPFAGEAVVAATAQQQQQVGGGSSITAGHEKSEVSSFSRGHSIESLPSEETDYSTMAMAGTSPTPSISNMLITHSNSGGQLNLRGRSPGRSVQLQDGSLVLPGMKARPRGQSPEKGKRPDYYSNPSSTGPSAAAAAAGSLRNLGSSGSGALGLLPISGGPNPAAAAGGGTAAAVAAVSGADSLHAAAAGGVSRLEMQLSTVELSGSFIQPPSAAAVLRHSSSTGDLFGSAGLPGAAGAGAAAAAAEAAAKPRRRVRISSTGLDTSESAEDSDAADDILPTSISTAAATLADGSLTAAAAAARVGSSSNRVSGSGTDVVLQPSELAADAAAAAAKGTAYFRKLRRERKQPAEGIEFPTFQGSDVGSSSSSDGSSCDEGSTSEDDQTDGCIIGRSSSSSGLSDDDTAAAADIAAAVSGGGSSSSRGPPITSEPDHPQKALTLIDYEYSGFNPVAYDIANHWCEWAADYHTDQPHVLDFRKLPTEQQQRDFVEAYLRELLASSGVTVAEADTADNAGQDVRLGGCVVTDKRSAAAAAASDAGSSIDGADCESLDDLWSTLSSRGGSVISMLSVAEHNMETMSQRSAALSIKSLPAISSSSNTEPQAAAAAAAGAPTLAKLAAAAAVPGGGSSNSSTSCLAAAAAGGVPSLAKLAAAAAAGPTSSSSSTHCPAATAAAAAASGLSATDLRSLWRWIDLHQPDRHLLLTQQQLDSICFNRMVGSLLAAARAYVACSHLLWALWGVIQSKVSDVDFDFEGYGQQRWQQYLLTRPSGLQGKQCKE